MSTSTPGKRRYEMSSRAEEVAKTRERLLEAAMRHFVSRPFEEVRLREIAEEAKVTAPTLHAHFHSKEQLFVSAYMWWGQGQLAHRDTAPVGDPPRAVRVLFDHYEAHGEGILRVLSQEERIATIKTMTDAGRVLHRRWVSRTFEPSLQGLSAKARERRLSALVVATDLLVWKLLRREMGKSRREAEQVVVEMIAGTG
jgi:AcrR family transcriptional regulator